MFPVRASIPTTENTLVSESKLSVFGFMLMLVKKFSIKSTNFFDSGILLHPPINYTFKALRSKLKTSIQISKIFLRSSRLVLSS